MKLYRYTNQGEGVMSGRATDRLWETYRESMEYDYDDDTYFDEYKRLMKELHAPMYNEFKGGSTPPENALFYFTEKGIKKYKSLISELYKVYNGYDFIIDETIIELSNYKRYNVWYRDSYQICVELIK